MRRQNVSCRCRDQYYVARLILTHRERPSPYIQPLVQFDVDSKSFVQVIRRFVKVVEHVIRKISDSVICGASDRHLVVFSNTPVIDRFEADQCISSIAGASDVAACIAIWYQLPG